MSKIMKTTALPALFERIAGEYTTKRSIFEIPESTWLDLFEQEAESAGMPIMASTISIPLGPAAGPHTQIAPNLIAAYLSGARVFELKTVQENDHLDIDKPCIDALDEGYNVEWSTELSLEEARIEYINAWLVINLFARIWSHKPSDFLFNMSVGYTLEGLKSAKMEAFIEGMRRPETGSYWERALEELKSFVESPLFMQAFGSQALEKARSIAEHMPVRPVHSVTLSTMHGCPPEEIERIGRYLIEEKGFDTYIKLNPTLLGYEDTRTILDRLGWKDIVLKSESFEHDLQFDMAISLIHTLSEVAFNKGRRFGIKLSNTLANINNGDYLPGFERYLSGRALFPITINLAAKLAHALPDFGARFSYCGGVSAFNAADLIRAGMGPLTIATDLLKPGGYQRLGHMVKDVLSSLPFAPEKPDLTALDTLAEGVFSKPYYRKDWKEGTASIEGPLPLFDCFAAPCIEACPVGQKVPAYVAATGAGNANRGLSIVTSDNPFPTITGILCDHICQEHCSRVDYEGAVRIRDMKLSTVRAAVPESENEVRPAWPRKAIGNTAIIGAGPAGLTCAWYLAQHGQKAVIFEKLPIAGGVPSTVIPSFRISREDIASDIDKLEKLSVEFRFGTEISTIEDCEALKRDEFDSIVIAHGAYHARNLVLDGDGVKVMHALDFLRSYMEKGLEHFSGVKTVLVVGGGNTACDSVRLASRIPGIEHVYWSYRRSRKEMPADKEELANAIAEATALTVGCDDWASFSSQDLSFLRNSSFEENNQESILLELTLPEALEPGMVRLRRMKPGEKDESGRPSPVPTDETFLLPCDLIITAVGEAPDPTLFSNLGVEVSKNDLPIVDEETMESSIPGIYICGDARRGPSSIIASEADGRAAAYAILKKREIEVAKNDYRAPLWDSGSRSNRGKMIEPLSPDDPSFAEIEAERCLACDSACLRCVEVCPNRANIIIETGRLFDQPAQILHIDRLCNECGNCARFCLWKGEPYKHKPTLFDTLDDLRVSNNAGFAFFGNVKRPSLVFRAKVGDAIAELPFSAWNGVISLSVHRVILALARVIWSEHRYLVEVHE